MQYSEGFEELIINKSFLPPEFLVKAINEDFKNFSGTTEIYDDITYIAMQINPIPEDRLSLRFASDINTVNSMMSRIQIFLQRYVEDTELFLTGINEIVNNAAEHGNKFEPQKKITVDAVVVEKYVSITVEDQGEGFDWKKQIDVPFDIYKFEEQGRGIILTKMCFSDNINFNEQGNKVTLLKKR